VAVDTCARGSGALALTSVRRQSVVVIWGNLFLVSDVRANNSFPSCSISFSVLVSCEQTGRKCFESIYHASSKSIFVPTHQNLAVHPGRAAADQNCFSEMNYKAACLGFCSLPYRSRPTSHVLFLFVVDIYSPPSSPDKSSDDMMIIFAVSTIASSASSASNYDRSASRASPSDVTPIMSCPREVPRISASTSSTSCSTFAKPLRYTP